MTKFIEKVWPKLGKGVAVVGIADGRYRYQPNFGHIAFSLTKTSKFLNFFYINFLKGSLVSVSPGVLLAGCVGSAAAALPLSTGARKWCLEWGGAKQRSDFLLTEITSRCLHEIPVVIKVKMMQSGGEPKPRPSFSPITPDVAKLGDWIKDIQAQIEKLAARCKLNEDEISVHKNLYNLHMVDFNTKIGQIMGGLDKMQDTEKESVDYVNSEIEEVRKMKAKVRNSKKL